MDWADDGIVLSMRRHGESAAVVHLLTREHGRHAGLVRGGNSKKNAVSCSRGMKSTRVGGPASKNISGHSRSNCSMACSARSHRPWSTGGNASACSLVDICLPEREPHPDLFASLQAMFSILPEAEWAAAYVAWELSSLAELGFGLDLSACAATGIMDDLSMYRPRAAGRYLEMQVLPTAKNSPLPQFLIGRVDVAGNAVSEGLRLTAYFLERHVLTPQDKLLPDARSRIARSL